MEMSATYPAIIYVVVVCCLYFCPKTNQIRCRYEKISDDDDLDRACGKLELNIDITFFFKFIKEKIAYEYNLNTEFCQITESHYFRGRYRVNDANNKHLLFSERKFEDSLIENDVIFHYKHLREIQKEGEINVIEKGIDVWFALEAYELSLFRKFDFVILITGDADHEMLIKKLKALKIHTILLTWDLSPESATARLLREEACKHIELSEIAIEDKDLIKKICRSKQKR